MSQSNQPRRQEPRLSREISSQSETPPRDFKKSNRRNTSSVDSDDRTPASGSAEEVGNDS